MLLEKKRQEKKEKPFAIFSKSYYFGASNWRILVRIFYLISIGLSLSDEANKMQFLNIEKA